MRIMWGCRGQYGRLRGGGGTDARRFLRFREAKEALKPAHQLYALPIARNA